MSDINDKEYAHQMVALLRRLTEADGEVSTLEKRWVRRLMQELPTGSEDAAISDEFDPQRLKELVSAEGEADELIELLLLISLADGETSPEEWSLIQSVAELVGVSPEALESMRAETVLTVEP